MGVKVLTEYAAKLLVFFILLISTILDVIRLKLYFVTARKGFWVGWFVFISITQNAILTGWHVPGGSNSHGNKIPR